MPLALCLLLALAFAAACDRTARTVEMAPGPATSPAQPPVVDLVSYGVALSRVVNGERIMPRTLVKSAAHVEAFLHSLADCGPRCTPAAFASPAHRLAYYINAHNAAMLRTLIDLDVGGRLARQLPANADRRLRFRIDGAGCTVADLRRLALAEAGADWRVRLTLYAGRMDGPPLPPRAFLPDLLDSQLDEAVRLALASDMVVRPHFGVVKRLLLCRQLFDARQQLVADYERRVATSGASVLNAVGDWCDRFRRESLNAAVGYPVSIMPADDRINKIDYPASKAVITAEPR